MWTKFALAFWFQSVYEITSDIWNVDHRPYHVYECMHDGHLCPPSYIFAWYDTHTIGGHFKCQSMNIFIDIGWKNEQRQFLLTISPAKWLLIWYVMTFFAESLNHCYDNLFILVWYKDRGCFFLFSVRPQMTTMIIMMMMELTFWLTKSIMSHVFAKKKIPI